MSALDSIGAPASIPGPFGPAKAEARRSEWRVEPSQLLRRHLSCRTIQAGVPKSLRFFGAATFALFWIGTGALGAAEPPHSPEEAPWWSLFHDGTLDRLEKQALADNPDLRQSVQRVDEARAQAAAFESSRYPQVTAPLSASRQRTTNTGPVGSSRLVGANPFASSLSSSSSPSFAAQALSNNFNDFQAPLAVSYEVDVFGRVRHAFNQARAMAEATAAERLAVRLSLTSQVASNYFAVRAADSTVDALRRGVKLRDDAVEIEQERVKGGSASDLDLLRARVEKSNADADLAEALQERQALENALAELCGAAAGEFHLAPQPLDSAPPPAIPSAVPAQAITRRPDLMEAEKRILAAGEGVQAARSHFLPVLKTGADYGFESAQTNQLFESQSRIWTITGSISIPIFDGGRNASDLKVAQARNEEALSAYRMATLAALREVDTALSNLRQRAVQAEARGRAADDARRVVDASQQSYQKGAMSYFEVIDAQRVLLSAEIAQARTLGGRYAATVDLVRALGGGF